MFFVIKAKDKPNSLELRLKTREVHLKYLNDYLPKLKMAGPLILNNNPVGSLLIIEANSLEDAQNWAKNDPYNIAGLFMEVTLEEVKLTFWN